MKIKNYTRFLKILQKESPILYDATMKTIINNNVKNEDLTILQISASVSGPILYNYVSWLLEDAIRRKVSRLYFLARDGFIMYELANIIIKKRNIDIECKYIYASRFAWRLPQYFLDYESSLDKIFVGSIDITLRKIFNRVNFTNKEINNVLKDLRMSKHSLDLVLDYNQLMNLKKILGNNRVFYNFVYKHSKECYDSTIGYLRQEGFFDDISYALVDSGWSGSMQQSLDQLIQSDYKTQSDSKGYYFGMYSIPINKNKINYFPYYFKPSGMLKRKIYFNNNLFECFCCSNDGMTIGYDFKDGKYVPIFSSDQNLNVNIWNVDLQIQTIKKFAEYVNDDKYLYYKHDFRKLIFKLCKSFMIYPSNQEAEVYGKFKFSDDISEEYVNELAINMELEDITKNYIFQKCLHKLNIKKYDKRNNIKQSAWIDGSIVRSNIKNKYYAHYNMLLLRLIISINSNK